MSRRVAVLVLVSAVVLWGYIIVSAARLHPASPPPAIRDGNHPTLLPKPKPPTIPKGTD